MEILSADENLLRSNYARRAGKKVVPNLKWHLFIARVAYSLTFSKYAKGLSQKEAPETNVFSGLFGYSEN